MVNRALMTENVSRLQVTLDLKVNDIGKLQVLVNFPESVYRTLNIKNP